MGAVLEQILEHPVAPTQWQTRPFSILIASGPSLTQKDVDSCRGLGHVLVVNDNYKLAPWADCLYACDPQWWEHHEGAAGFQGQRWTILPRSGQREAHRRAADRWGLRWVDGEHRPGLSFDPHLIHQGSNSGYQALNLAIHFMGGRNCTVLLLGYDMQSTGGKSHWFGDHPPGIKRPSPYKQFAEAFNSVSADLKANDITVVNCSRESALTTFPKMKLEDALDKFVL